MCRVAGMINPGMPARAIEQVVAEMCDLQKHGGPDDEGLYTSEPDNLVLGNRRLALLDLSQAGHQPMQYQSRYHITYNGELYNFAVLKQELIKLGHHFKTHTDTEVIEAAFAQWNTHSFAKFNGMFAFALWDDTEKELYLVRDAAGIKPLYYSTISGTLTFASEVRAFKAVPFLQEANANWPVYLMAYGHIPEPVCTLAQVKPLHKGCFLKYSVKQLTYSLQSFAHYSYTCQLQKDDDPYALIKKATEQAVQRHLVADAPIGVFLSGGLDSGIIATLASKFKHNNLKTLSLYFKEAAFSEKEHQDVLIQKLNCLHGQYLLKEEEFHSCFPTILQSMDMPGCDGINTWFISKYAAAQGLKAVLSGIGADELFGGYPSFRRMKATRLLQHMPAMASKINERSNLKQLNRLAYLRMDGVKGVYLFLRGHFTPYEIAKQLGADEKEIWTLLNEQPMCTDISRLSEKNQASWMEFNLYMQNQLLHDADVMSMAHGVEIRLPFLDDNLVRVVLKLDPGIKYKGMLPKQFLIDIFKKSLPETIWNRPKMGFSLPFAKWLANNVYVKEVMQNSRRSTQENYKKFSEGNLHWSHLMSLIILRKYHLA
ncbi:MAG: asparagine synthase (glutamine-hydrolyzing) [Ginsengibacter sp.]